MVVVVVVADKTKRIVTNRTQTIEVSLFMWRRLRRHLYVAHALLSWRAMDWRRRNSRGDPPSVMSSREMWLFLSRVMTSGEWRSLFPGLLRRRYSGRNRRNIRFDEGISMLKPSRLAFICRINKPPLLMNRSKSTANFRNILIFYPVTDNNPFAISTLTFRSLFEN